MILWDWFRHLYTFPHFHQNGDIVMLKTEPNRNQWPMAKVIGVNVDDMGFI